MAALIFEAQDSIASNLNTYRHVRLFSPWRYNLDAAAARLLQADGWSMPAAEDLPTAGELMGGTWRRWPLAVGQPSAA